MPTKHLSKLIIIVSCILFIQSPRSVLAAGPNDISAFTLNAVDDTGTSNSDRITNNTMLTFSVNAGFDGDFIRIFPNGTDANSSISQCTISTTSCTLNIPEGSYTLQIGLADAASGGAVAGAYVTQASIAAFTLEVDTTVPGTPGITSPNNNQTFTSMPVGIFGTTVGGQVRVVSSIDGQLSLTTEAAGIFTRDVGGFSEGTHTISITVLDTAGNESAADTITGVLVDTIAPVKPTNLILLPSSDSGVSNSDRITNITTPDFQVDTEAGATVTISSNLDGQVGFRIGADGDDTFVGSSTTMTAGVHSITAVATDPAGNVSVGSDAITITIDTTAPSASSAPSLLTSSDTGTSSSDGITSDATPEFSGTAPANTLVQLTSSVDGTVGSAASDGAGDWSFTTTTLSQGSHQIQANTSDTAGNQSATSTAISVTVDTTAPTTPVIASPTSGATIGTLRPTIMGTGETSSSIQISNNGTPFTGSSTVSAGTWSFTLPSDLENGANTLTAQATDTAGNQSASSTAIALNLDRTDTDGDGTIDLDDNDDDNDGLDDVDEPEVGTDPLDSDSDDDRVLDGQEVTDGTNPLDAGSYRLVVGTSFCSEWNGFLDGLWNIMELVNVTTDSKIVQSTLKDIVGVNQSSEEYAVSPGGQTDVIVHGISGWTNDSYGQICSEVTGGVAGDIDGRMVYYKPNSVSSVVSSDIQFAFALPFQNGLAGTQYIFFNTYQPSLDPIDADNIVTNWVQIVNLGASEQSGTLKYYGQDGSLLATDTPTLPAGARVDYAAHQFGRNLVGMVEWSPNDATALFQVTEIRYYYDNPFVVNTFDAAFNLSGIRGSGEVIVSPADTRGSTAVLELGNVSNASATAEVKVYDASGNLILDQINRLDAKASVHLILDDILIDALGYVTVNGSATGSFIATVMQYGRTTTGGLQYLYGIQAKEPSGSSLRGSYNTYLGQGCSLLVSNAHTAAQTINYDVIRSNGELIVGGVEQSINANGIAEIDVCVVDSPNNYGVVRVSPQIANTVSAIVVRKAAADAYRFPTEVR